MGGGWLGPKDGCLLASLRLDPFCDTTSTHFSPNLTVKDASLNDFRAQGRCSTVIYCKNRRKQLLYRDFSTACHCRGAGVQYTCV